MWKITSRSARWRRCLFLVVAGGAVFAGPCGITTLQLQDTLRSTIIRTGVITVFAALESAIIGAAGQPESGDR